MNTLLFHLVLLTFTILPASSTLWFLRGTSGMETSKSSSAHTVTTITTTTTDDPYDDLIQCMWNGTTVGACHALNCKWCHSSFSDICVTQKYAAHLNGNVFHCEGPEPPSTDDDATPPSPPPPANDDDTIVTPKPTPAPTTSAPTTAPPSPNSDDVLPVTDDDPNHDANDKYMERLLHCMAIVHGGPKACSADKWCTWCTIAKSSHTPTNTTKSTTSVSVSAGVGTNGMCFSHQAAKEMNGPYYQCDLTIMTTSTM